MISPTVKLGTLAAVAWSILLVLGCSENQSSPSTDAGGAAGAAPVVPTLRFEVDGATPDHPSLELQPEQDYPVTVVVDPPDRYRVRFSIIEEEHAPPVDASLEETDVPTNKQGRASVRLWAPSTQSAFELRASIGNIASASLDVRVREKSYGELEVIPSYTGRRPIEEWFTVAYPSETCPIPPPTSLADASCRNVTEPCAVGPPGAALRIVDIWAGPSYAVTLGAGNHVFGCANVDEILPKELTLVTVTVLNRPISLEEEPLTAVLGISETLDPWIQHLNATIDAATLAFTSDAPNDLARVLDVMADLVEEAEGEEVRAGFDQRREDYQWVNLAVSSLSSPDGLLLRSRLRGWMQAGAIALQSDEAFIGRINPVGRGQFEFEVTESSGVDAATAGFAPPEAETTTWTADADDTLVLGTQIQWAPSRLVTALAESQAVLEHPDQSNLEGALGELLDCNALAEALFNSNKEGIYPGCDESCGAELCTSALAALTQSARDAALDPQVLEVSAAGPAVVDELARPASFEGTWLGSFPGGERALSGSIDGEPTGAAD